VSDARAYAGYTAAASHDLTIRVLVLLWRMNVSGVIHYSSVSIDNGQ
jgi:hypothetical protein